MSAHSRASALRLRASSESAILASQALNTVSRGTELAELAEELPDVQGAPKFDTVDVGAFALRLRASSESAILASHALNTVSRRTELAELVSKELVSELVSAELVS